MKRSYWQQNIQLTSLASCHGHWVWPAWRWWVIVLVLRLTWPITALAAPTSAFSGAIQPAKNCTEPTDPSTCDCSYVTSDSLWMQPLIQPDNIKAASTMSYELHVQNQNWCIPGFDGTAWQPLPASLQTYGYCEAGSCDTLTWSIPAPTFRLNKASAAGSTDGTQFQLKLVNELTPGYTAMTNPTYTGDSDAGYMDCLPKKLLQKSNSPG